jgi:hypothetical protein
MVQQSSQGGRGGEREFTRHPGGGGGLWHLSVCH